MTRALHLFHQLNQGPHGRAASAIALTACVVPMLIVSGGLFTLWSAVMAVAVGITTAMLALVMAVLSRLRAKLNDVHYAMSFENGLRRAGYQIDELFTDGAAANPSLQLHILKILLFCRPTRILELGSGQSTKLLSAYAREHADVTALTLEQDRGWIERLKGAIAHDYRHAPLEDKAFTCRGSGLRLTTRWYQEIPELQTRKFDFILVDGPDPGTSGTAHTNYARSGILQYLPDALAETFVVIFDDAERYGELMTVAALEAILQACKRRYIRFTIHGMKDQVVLCSPDLAFLRSI